MSPYETTGAGFVGLVVIQLGLQNIVQYTLLSFGIAAYFAWSGGWTFKL
jgi:hypothetical protein